jgi:hypothetical protein
VSADRLVDSAELISDILSKIPTFDITLVVRDLMKSFAGRFSMRQQ